MSGVSLQSVESLREFRGVLCKLAGLVQAALSEADSELSRTADWLTRSQALHWKAELRVRAEELTRARSALTRKKAEKSPTGARQSTVEEEKAFQRAQRRLEEAQQKAAAVQRWIRQLDHVAFTYRPVAQGLMTTVEVDVPRGLARLDDMVASLEAYLAGGARPQWVSSQVAEGEMRREPVEGAAWPGPAETPAEGHDPPPGDPPAEPSAADRP